MLTVSQGVSLSLVHTCFAQRTIKLYFPSREQHTAEVVCYKNGEEYKHNEEAQLATVLRAVCSDIMPSTTPDGVSHTIITVTSW